MTNNRQTDTNVFEGDVANKTQKGGNHCRIFSLRFLIHAFLLAGTMSDENRQKMSLFATPCQNTTQFIFLIHSVLIRHVPIAWLVIAGQRGNVQLCRASRASILVNEHGYSWDVIFERFCCCSHRWTGITYSFYTFHCIFHARCCSLHLHPLFPTYICFLHIRNGE